MTVRLTVDLYVALLRSYTVDRNPYSALAESEAYVTLCHAIADFIDRVRALSSEAVGYPWAAYTLIQLIQLMPPPQSNTEDAIAALMQDILDTPDAQEGTS